MSSEHKNHGLIVGFLVLVAAVLVGVAIYFDCFSTNKNPAQPKAKEAEAVQAKAEPPPADGNPVIVTAKFHVAFKPE
jgi:flagellar basal body-associated protein FliL